MQNCQKHLLRETGCTLFSRWIIMNSSFFLCNHVIEQNAFDENANKKKSHYHDHYEIFYFIGDTMAYFIDDRPIKLEKYDLLLIPPQTYHRSTYFDNTNQERLIISFSVDFFDLIGNDDSKQKTIKVFDRYWLRIVDSKIRTQIYNTMMNIAQVIKTNQPTGSIRAQLLLYELLLHLEEIIDDVPADNSREMLTPLEKNIHDIVSYINKQYMKKITLDDIANRFYISKYYLCRAFKQIIGLSVIDFINAKRLSEVALLLQNTDKTISQISASVGFSSQAFFIKKFKKTYGETPSEYRRRFIN